MKSNYTNQLQREGPGYYTGGEKQQYFKLVTVNSEADLPGEGEYATAYTVGWTGYYYLTSAAKMRELFENKRANLRYYAPVEQPRAPQPGVLPWVKNVEANYNSVVHTLSEHQIGAHEMLKLILEKFESTSAAAGLPTMEDCIKFVEEGGCYKNDTGPNYSFTYRQFLEFIQFVKTPKAK